MPARRYDIIDADGHVLEPPDLWTKYIDPQYRDRAPVIVIDSDGEERLRVEGRVLGGKRGLRVAGMVGAREGLSDPKNYLEGKRGGFDPQARIADLDLDGIDAVFLYPTLALFTGAVEDQGLAAAIARAYNRWIADYCALCPDRLFGVAMLPMQSVEHAVDELRFARNTLGLRAGFVRPNPYNNRLLNDPAYDPLWAEAQELNCPIGIHEGTAGGMQAVGVDRVVGRDARHIVSHTMEMMLASLNLIWGGVCERYPRLKFAFLESGGGWIAPWLDRMDRHFDDRIFREETPPLRPSEYFKRQCWISFEPVEGCLPLLADYLGANKILWATDYPHRDGFFPGAPEMIRKMLPERLWTPVLSQGAIEFYNLH